MSAHERNGTLCRHARPCAPLVEHHGHRLASQGAAGDAELLIPGHLGLAGGGIPDELGELGR